MSRIDLKPTGAQLYREWTSGRTIRQLTSTYKCWPWQVEDAILAYLIDRDKRRKRCRK